MGMNMQEFLLFRGYAQFIEQYTPPPPPPRQKKLLAELRQCPMPQFNIFLRHCVYMHYKTKSVPCISEAVTYQRWSVLQWWRQCYRRGPADQPHPPVRWPLSLPGRLCLCWRWLHRSLAACSWTSSDRSAEDPAPHMLLHVQVKKTLLVSLWSLSKTSSTRMTKACHV